MDITPNAVDHLNYAQYFPICVYLQAESHSEVKELRQKYAKHLKAKSSKRLFESAAKLSSQYSHLFTANVALESAHWFKRLKEVIEAQQNCPLWISQDIESNESQTQNSATSANSFDFGLQQQKFVAKQSLLLQQVERKQFDDNFELPMYSMSGRGMSGAASTYSLYEDQNYRSSFASESDGCVSQQDKVNESTCHPIYSTNFQSRSHSVFFNQESETKPDSSTPDKPDPRITRVLSDSSLANPSQSHFNQGSTNNCAEKAETQNSFLVKAANRQATSPETSCVHPPSNSLNNETVS